MTHIVFLERKSIGPSIELIKPKTNHTWKMYDQTSPKEIVERLKNADIAIVNKIPITKKEINQLSTL